jgi:hypothetical protein
MSTNVRDQGFLQRSKMTAQASSHTAWVYNGLIKLGGDLPDHRTY